MKVCMFVKNTFQFDARVTREARALVEAGHEVTVVAIHAPLETEPHEVTPEGIEVRRVSRGVVGMHALNRIARRYSGSLAERRARLSGDEGNESGPATPRSGATPGSVSQTPSPRPVSSGRATDRTPPRQPLTLRLRRLWADITTPVLKIFARAARSGFLLTKALIRRQPRLFRMWGINRRMVAVGVGLGADVYHCHDLNTLYVGQVCKRRTGAVLVYDSHELQTERNRMGFWWKLWATWNERRRLSHVDALIVAAPLWIDHLQNKYGRLPALTQTVLNVPEPTTITPRDLRTPLALEPNSRLLVYQGSIQENRGIEPAIEAIGLLPEDVHLVIIGYGYYRDTLQDLVKQQQLDHRIHFYGPVPNHELLHWTASADIGLCNIINSSISYYTTLPNKLFEYAMAQVPVIGSDSPGIGQLITQTGIGEVIDPQNPHHIAQATHKILHNPHPYKTACQTAQQTYNWTTESQHLTNLYQKLDAGSHDPDAGEV